MQHPTRKSSPINLPNTIVFYNIYHQNSFEMMNYRIEYRFHRLNDLFSFFDMFDRVLLILHRR